MIKKGLLLISFLILSFPLSAKISFGKADLNNKDEVLFTVKQDMAGTNPYQSLFYSKLVNGEPEKIPEILTCYPEQMELLNGGKTLQLRNRYGKARYNSETNSLEWIKTVTNLPVNTIPVVPYAVSPDGMWECHIERNSLSTGFLVLENNTTGVSEILCENISLSYEKVPVKWSPDSSVLLYEKKGNVYFCNPEAIVRGVEIEEKYRKIGRGTINSVYWSSAKYLAYIDDYLLYRINAKELYTLGLYSGIIGQGKVAGRLPFQFDAQSDKFSSNADVSAIVVVQNNRLFSYLSSKKLSCEYMDVIYSRPYTDSKASLVDSYVFWTNLNTPILWLEKLPYDGNAEKGSVYRLGLTASQVLEIEDSGRPFISPDGTKVAFFAGAAIYVYDINTWKRIASLTGEKIVSALWINGSSLYVGGEKSIRKWNISSNSSEVITLSSAVKGFWSNETIITAENGENNWYIFDTASHLWKTVEPSEQKNIRSQNGRYRVFTGTTANSNFKNALYVRTLNKSAATRPVFPESIVKNDSVKKVSLVFDAYDNADGLPKILSVLKKYNVKGTFFINGEFIRRYPSETQQIVNNGHECAAMFFSATDLTNNTFVIDEEFIRRGLARNEDEFFDCTGKELTLFWHAPFYAVNQSIKDAGNNAGYTYVELFNNHNDTIKFSKNIPAEQLINEYYSSLENAKTGIIPVAVGYSLGHNVDPLYNSLDILISALIDGGFEFYTITEMQ